MIPRFKPGDRVRLSPKAAHFTEQIRTGEVTAISPLCREYITVLRAGRRECWWAGFWELDTAPAEECPAVGRKPGQDAPEGPPPTQTRGKGTRRLKTRNRGNV